MRRPPLRTLALALGLAVASPAAAQHLPAEPDPAIAPPRWRCRG